MSLTAEVFCADEQDAHPVDIARWAALAERVLDAEGVGAEVEVSVVFVDEATIAGLNGRFAGRDEPTDVLSFPIDDEPPESGRHPDSGGSGPGEPSEPDELPLLLGDVYVCPSVAARNAPDHAGTYEDELALLVVHGILHLLGMDHEDAGEAEEMEQRERALLARFHSPPPDGELPPLAARTTGPWLPPRTGDATPAELLRREGGPDGPDDLDGGG
jgi:probable rRNA maturation factor